MRRHLAHLAVVIHFAHKHASALIEADGDRIAHLRLMRGEPQLEALLHLPGADGVLWLDSGIAWQILRRIYCHGVLCFTIGFGVGRLRFDPICLREQR